MTCLGIGKYQRNLLFFLEPPGRGRRGGHVRLRLRRRRQDRLRLLLRARPQAPQARRGHRLRQHPVEREGPPPGGRGRRVHPRPHTAQPQDRRGRRPGLCRPGQRRRRLHDRGEEVKLTG